MEMEGTSDIKKLLQHYMEGEITNFIKVWLSVYVSLTYCYFSGKILRRGTPRLAAFLPVVALFLLLPLKLHSMHLGGLTSFFIAWLANFKLLLFAFNKGPLSDPSVSLPRFLAITSLPIKLHNPETKNQKNHRKGKRSLLSYAIKGLFLALFVKIYDYSDYLNRRIILVMYCFHIYFFLEITMAMAGALAEATMGAELEQQFNAPFLSTSLQDFWGRRWNLMVSRILRPTVYEPVLNRSADILGRKWAPFPAIMSTFAVSGLMHELIFYYFGRVRPTWEITCLFLLHGSCLMGEIALKRLLSGKFHVPRFLGTICTVGFVIITGFWLFFPQFLRCKADERAFAEYAAVGAFVKDFFF